MISALFGMENSLHPMSFLLLVFDLITYFYIVYEYILLQINVAISTLVFGLNFLCFHGEKEKEIICFQTDIPI